MSDADDADGVEDELAAIRQRKRERLEAKLRGEAPDDAGSESDGRAAPDEPIHVEGADQFQELIATYDVALVDFYADWCGPCKMIAPIVEQLAAETPAAVLKVDSDVHQGLATQYGVRGLPTLLVVADGEVVERVTGARGKDQLEALLRRHL